MGWSNGNYIKEIELWLQSISIKKLIVGYRFFLRCQIFQFYFLFKGGNICLSWCTSDPIAVHSFRKQLFPIFVI
jgi:hypothetical protein